MSKHKKRPNQARGSCDYCGRVVWSKDKNEDDWARDGDGVYHFRCIPTAAPAKS